MVYFGSETLSISSEAFDEKLGLLKKVRTATKTQGGL